MSRYRTALQFSVLLISTLSVAACSGGGGGGPPQQNTGGAAIPGGDDGGGQGQAGIAVTITDPGATEIETTDDTMDLSGTASSDSGLSSVSWKSNKGKSGTAEGTDSWSISNIPLEAGTNKITVTATTPSGKTKTDTIVIKRESKGTGSVTLSWVPPTERTDGTPLDNLAGYKVSFGRMSEVYDYTIDLDNPGLATYVVEELVPGDWYFAVVAYDTEGLESEFSNEAHRAVE